MADPINYSRTHRILLLIDLHTILISNPKPYLQAIRASAESILTFSSLSSSLFSFKFFYSSLPLLSYPTKPPLSLRFDEPAATLGLLTEALDSLTELEKKRMDDVARCSRALFVDMALRQVLHGYKWEEAELEEGMGFGVVRSNLVLVLSPVGDEIEFVKDFLDVANEGEVLGGLELELDRFVGRFRDVFEHVRNAYGRNDMHLSWIDVKTEIHCVDSDVGDVKCEVFRKGLRSLGWGFCSTDSVVLGSALVPIGLIYPLIGLDFDVRNYDGSSRKRRAQLNLEIADASGKPLECKCCDLELVETNLLKFGYHGQELICWNNEGNAVGRKSLFDHTYKDSIKLQIQAVMKYSEFEKMKSRLMEIVLVTESVRKSGKHSVNVSSEFYADKVLKKLRLEMGNGIETDSPLWNILLSYLYKENQWGIASLTDGNGNSFTGIIKPFTFDSALLFIVDSVSWPQTEDDGLNITKSVTHADENSHSKDEQPGINDTPVQLSQVGDKGRKRSRLLKSLNWSVFCKMAYESSRTDIGDAYFTSSYGKSKKLKFLKCWMKQIKKLSSDYYITFQPKQHPTPKELSDRLLQSSESELPTSSPASVGENSVSDIDRSHDAEASCLISETPECFLSNLTKRIQDGLDNESLDLGAFSERIVNSTILSLRMKFTNEDALQSDITAAPHTDTLTSKIASELANLLLMDPKDMKSKNNDIQKNTAADPCSFIDNSEAIKRRYELQILFRMEIIRSEVASCITESMKHKFVKHICMLLERIQCHLEGGFLGDWSLDSYLAKFLKTRYSHELEDILQQIYSKMDILLFSEEHEDFLPNSEDSSQSFKARAEEDTFGETKLFLGPTSADKKSHKQLRGKSLSLRRNRSTSHMQNLAKAQEQRERARRFSSFTSWIPDLQRVWAPKQQSQFTHSQSDLSRKHSKRPSRQCASLDMVFETPESNKKSCSRRSVDSPCSVSKALFQDTQ